MFAERISFVAIPAVFSAARTAAADFIAAENAELDQRAKDLVMRELKGNQNG